MIEILFVTILKFLQETLDLPVNNDNFGKQPLLRGSMSVQAIHLTTHESSLINSYVTDTILPQITQEGINDVSPINPSPHTHSNQLCPVTLTQQQLPSLPYPL